MTATIGIEELAMRSDDSCPIVKGRYMIVPAAVPTGKEVSHQRMTNFVKSLDDTYNVSRWECRNVALGVAHHDDLRDMIVSTRPDDKDELNDLCDKAKELAGGNKKSRQGTARHGITERIERGEIGIGDIPPSLRPDIEAYLRAMDAAGIEMLEIEQYVVHAELEVAGRLDRLVNFGSLPKVMDLKTGSLDYAAVTMAAQVFGYASADTFYDPATKTHRPMPDVDLEHGLIAHVPTGQGICNLYWVDLAVGRRGFELAADLRSLRKKRDVLDEWRPATTPDAITERTRNMVTRIKCLAVLDGAQAALAAAWPTGVPTFLQARENGTPHSAAELDAIDTVLCAVETKFQAPFGPLDSNHNASLIN